MLTIKSDDVVGRAKAFEAIVKGTEIPTSSVPESFNVLVKELQSLGLQVIPLGVKIKSDTASAPADDNVVADSAVHSTAFSTIVQSDLTGDSLDIKEEL